MHIDSKTLRLLGRVLFLGGVAGSVLYGYLLTRSGNVTDRSAPLTVTSYGGYTEKGRAVKFYKVSYPPFVLTTDLGRLKLDLVVRETNMPIAALEKPSFRVVNTRTGVSVLNEKKDSLTAVRHTYPIGWLAVLQDGDYKLSAEFGLPDGYDPRSFEASLVSDAIAIDRNVPWVLLSCLGLGMALCLITRPRPVPPA